jgi:ElaB/YqjD/DUF883 family membrane-anchored ribosome-binding protein
MSENFGNDFIQPTHSTTPQVPSFSSSPVMIQGHGQMDGQLHNQIAGENAVHIQSQRAENQTSTYGARPTSIDEALKALDTALAENKSTDLGELITDEYQNLRSALVEFSPGFTEAVRTASQQAYERAGEIAEYAAETFERSRKVASEMAVELDQNVRTNPWPFLGGVAVGTFALGFLIGRNNMANKMRTSTQSSENLSLTQGGSYVAAQSELA